MIVKGNFSIDKVAYSDVTREQNNFIYRVGQKTVLFLRSHNFAMIERRVICEKVQNFVWNEVRNLYFSAAKYSLPNLHKSSVPPKLQ